MASGYVVNAATFPITVVLNNGTPKQLDSIALASNVTPSDWKNDSWPVPRAGGQDADKLGTSNILAVSSAWYTGKNLTDPVYTIGISLVDVSANDDVVIVVLADGVLCVDAHTGGDRGFTVHSTGGLADTP